MRNLVILLAKRKIQGYVSDNDYEKIMSIVYEIRMKSMRIANRDITIGDAIKEAFISYANHQGLIKEGWDNGFKFYYYNDSFFEKIFERINKAEKFGIDKWNNQIAKYVIREIFDIMNKKDEIAKKNDIENIEDMNEQWNAIVDYVKGIYGEYQEFKKEKDLKSDEENK